MELSFPRMSNGNLKEQLVRTTLRNVRSQGHPYVELREDGKKLIFYCTLCLAPCYSDSVLFNHLKGNQHTERLVTAKATLLKPNPWPFSDGVFFFHDDQEEQVKSLDVLDTRGVKLLNNHRVDEDRLAIVSYGENLGPNKSIHVSLENGKHADFGEISCDPYMDGQGTNQEIVIPAVLQKYEISDLVVRHVGVGRIGARFSEKDGVSDGIHRIWCEWLGKKDLATENMGVVPEHEFAIVTFPYNYNLGRKVLFEGFKYMLPSSPHSEAEDSGCCRGKKRKSFSDPDDISNQYDSSEEESQSSNNSISKIVLSGNDDQLVNTRILLSKTMRKELRKQQRIASERSCDICQQKMLLNKDVAALLNRSTGKFVCSSRNFTGAFHVFHISCLIHWILLCEVEVYTKQSVVPKMKRRSRRKTKTKRKVGEDKEKRVLQESNKQINSAFCPQCQGTGITIDGGELEKPQVPLSEIFKLKIKLCDAHKAWMKSPEVLQNCLMGFTFPIQSDELRKENVASLKLLHFYRADE